MFRKIQFIILLFLICVVNVYRANSQSLTIVKSSNGPWTIGATTSSYTLAVSNTGILPSIGQITVKDVLPAGFIPKWTGTYNVTNNGLTWSCTYVVQAVTCTTTSTLSNVVGSNTGNITLPVIPGSNTAIGSVTNYASIGGGGDLFNLGVAPTPGISCTDSNHCATAITEVTAQPALNSCGNDLYLTRSPSVSTNSSIYLTQGTSNPFVWTSQGETNYLFTSLGYSPNDSYLYAIQYGSTNLIRIGANATSVNLGAVTGLPAGDYNAADFSPTGDLYVKATVTNKIYKIDIPSMTAIGIPLTNFTGTTTDIAWYNGYLYTATTNASIYKIDPVTGASTILGANTLGTVGAMFGSANGLFATPNSGGFYQINVSTGAQTYISQAPGSSLNDGARCNSQPLLFPSNLAISKTDNSDTYKPSSTVTYTIVVTNSGTFGTQGFLVADNLPSGISTANWSCTGTNGGSCSASGTGSINDSETSLPVGASISYTLNLSVPETFTGNLTNTATVTSSPASSDPDTSDNSSTDTDLLAPPNIVLIKSCTMPADCMTESQQPGTDLTYKVEFTNNGGKRVYNLILVDSVPAETDFKLGSAYADAGTTALTFVTEYSNDFDPQNPSVATWGYTPISGGGSAQTGYDRNVRAVRWRIPSGTLSFVSPDNVGAIGFTTMIR
ncbi:MAG: DUF6923 family protein [Pyrinomonadaceae bacterium]